MTFTSEKTRFGVPWPLDQGVANVQRHHEGKRTWQRVIQLVRRSFSGGGLGWHVGSFFCLFGLTFFTLAPSPALAAVKGYDAKVDKKAVTLEMNPGETKTVTLTYTNTGSVTWSRTSRSYVALCLVNDATSPLGGAGWHANDEPGIIKSATVKPGKTTTVSFMVHAPVPGTFTEKLRLAATNVAWMRNAETLLTVNVRGKVATVAANPAPVVQNQVTPSATVATSSKTYAAALLLRSAREITLPGDGTQNVTFGFKNTGTSLWGSRSLVLAGFQPALSGNNLSLSDGSWRSFAEPVRIDTVTNPGEIGFLSFTLKAPAVRGTYHASFSLVADGQPVDGGLVDIPITVTSDGVIQTTPPITAPSQPAVIPGQSTFLSNQIPNAATLGQEPVIRVGIFATTDNQMIVSAAGNFRVMQDGATICSFTAGETVTVIFDKMNHVYKVSGPRCVGQSTAVYRVQGTDDPNLPLEMTDFSRPVSWLPGANDNKFRSILELRWSSVTDAVWVINELPMEMYLRGIAETSDSSPMEYQKALLTASRTYAYYHWRRATKHADEGFHVDAKYDQVYRGYGAEARSPNIVAAIQATRGQIVTYNNDLAITPFFSRSDGRTRNWTEVWGGSGYPWLVSVPVPEDAGKTLWGHGVGMSATGALGMANEGKLYQDILSHFYTGTTLQLFY
jgi:peptidoglycan hydrolase-like amidase